MSRYIKSENASITIEYNKSLFKSFIIDNYHFIDNNEIQRLYIECDINELNEVYKEIKSIEFNYTTTYLKIKNYSDNYFNVLSKISKNIMTIISTDIKRFEKIKIDNNSYYEIRFDYNEFQDIIRIINTNDNIILNINYDINNLKKVNEALINIVTNSKNEYLYFSNLFINKELIYKCPYNIYLNNKYSIRKYSNMLPQNISIDKNGKVYCANIKDKRIIIGDITEESIENLLKKCKKRSGYKNFILNNEKILIELLDQCPYQTIDYIVFLTEAMRSDE